MAILKGIRDKIKKLIQRKKTEKPFCGIREKLKNKKAPEGEKAGVGAEETAIETAKFSYPQDYRLVSVMPQELSSQYGMDRMVLQVRDPRWLHTYWEVTGNTLNSLKAKLGDAFYSAKRVLRVYDVSSIIFNGTNANSFFDLQINPDANNWYIDTSGPGRSWCVDLGLVLGDGTFIMILRSNVVATPLDGPSWITDEEWMIPDDMFARLYGMGFGFGRSSPVGKGWQEKIRKEFVSSPGVTSSGSPVKKMLKERKFWLMVNTELIVYGATEADAKVSVQGRQINLRPDGTFTLRFALPDGKQVIPVKAVSSDAQEERSITPIVNKETK